MFSKCMSLIMREWKIKTKEIYIFYNQSVINTCQKGRNSLPFWQVFYGLATTWTYAL